MKHKLLYMNENYQNIVLIFLIQNFFLKSNWKIISIGNFNILKFVYYLKFYIVECNSYYILMFIVIIINLNYSNIGFGNLFLLIKIMLW